MFWPTAAPLWVAESQVSACASWVLPRAFRSKKGLNLVVEGFQGGINFIILGSERRRWARLVSPVEVSFITKVVTTTAYTRRPRRPRGTGRALWRLKWERRSFECSYSERDIRTSRFSVELHTKATRNQVKVNNLLLGTLTEMDLQSSLYMDYFQIP